MNRDSQHTLVVEQLRIDGYRASQAIWNKAQSRREWHVLFKGCNAVPGHLGRSLRARREVVIRFVAPFDKGRAIAGKARRATNHFTSRCIHQSLVVRPLLENTV